jgi:putative transposase
VEIARTDPAPVRPSSVIGVDLGVKSLAVLSTGEVIANPRHLETAQRALRRWQRQAARRTGPDRRSGQRPSRRWLRTQARIATLHTAVADARRDGLHQLTTRLGRTHGTIVIEDLRVAGMLRNRRLARHIAGVGMGELRRQLGYQTRWRGGRCQVAHRWYPSSKTCSTCGAVKTTLRLSERTYRCDDLNAARNLAQLVDEAMQGMSSPSCVGDTKRARWKPAPDPHRAGSGYRHGKTPTTASGPTPPPQGDGYLNRASSPLLKFQIL